MARMRSIKPEFWGDFDTAETLSRDARLLYIALWNFCDEHARMAGDARYVKGHCFPYDDDLDPAAITGLLDELEVAGKVRRYEVDGAPYLVLPSLQKHQRLEAAKVPSRLPAPPDTDPPGSGADSSAPRANPSGTNAAQHVAGGMEHAAGSMSEGADQSPPHPVDNHPLPGDLAILKAKLDARRLTVRWDKLSDEQATEISHLVDLHGDAPLVKAALASFQPNNPPVFAQAWLGDWRALPPPGQLRVLEPPCPRGGHTGTFSHCPQCASERLAGDA